MADPKNCAIRTMRDPRIVAMRELVEDFRNRCLADPSMITDGNNAVVERSLLLIDAIADMVMFTPAQKARVIDAVWQSFCEAFFKEGEQHTEGAAAWN